MTTNNDDNQPLMHNDEERLALAICQHRNGDSILNQPLHQANSAQEFKVKSVAEFIAALKAMPIAASGGGHYLYRGLANATWEFLSSTELRLAQELPAKESGNLLPSPEEMISVFLDNSFISMLTAMLPIEPHNLQSYKDCLFWWGELRHKYELYISDEILIEISSGTISGQFIMLYNNGTL